MIWNRLSSYHWSKARWCKYDVRQGNQCLYCILQNLNFGKENTCYVNKEHISNILIKMSFDYALGIGRLTYCLANTAKANLFSFRASRFFLRALTSRFMAKWTGFQTQQARFFIATLAIFCSRIVIIPILPAAFYVSFCNKVLALLHSITFCDDIYSFQF